MLATQDDQLPGHCGGVGSAGITGILIQQALDDCHDAAATSVHGAFRFAGGSQMAD